MNQILHPIADSPLSTNPQLISIIGAGTMGNGIAHVFAQAGFEVRLIDTQQNQLDRALANISKNLERQVVKGTLSAEAKHIALSKIHPSLLLQDASNANLIIEAATENEEVKLNIFKQLDEIASPDAILATNTSSISITKIAAATKRPGKVIGMHFMNPVPVMKLVEIINGFATQKAVTDTIVEITRKLGKLPCVVTDFPGFVANRILMPMINEAIFCLQESVAEIEAIDEIMRSGMSHPMGPLQLADFIGLDVCLSILKVLYEGFGNPKYAPANLLVNMVAAGDLGVKSGQGFYYYEAGRKELVVSSRFKQ